MRAVTALILLGLLSLSLVHLQAPPQLVNGTWDEAAILAIDNFRRECPSADHNSFGPHTGPFSSYHNAKYFEFLAQRRGLGRLNAFDLGIDGATVASWFLSERSTPTFKMLFRGYDFARVGNLFSINQFELLDSWLSMTVPLVRDRNFYRAMLEEKVIALRCFAASGKKQRLTEETPHYAYQNTKLAPEAVMNRYLNSDESDRQKRYENQKLCLKKLLELADSRRIKVLLVSLPSSTLVKGEFHPKSNQIHEHFCRVWPILEMFSC